MTTAEMVYRAHSGIGAMEDMAEYYAGEAADASHIPAHEHEWNEGERCDAVSLLNELRAGNVDPSLAAFAKSLARSIANFERARRLYFRARP